MIQITSRKVNLPSRCPVCGEPATNEGTIPAMSAMSRSLGEEATRHTSFAGSGHFWSMGGSGYYGSSSGQMRLGAVSRFRIPTCEKHAISFEETARLRGTCGMCNGILIIVTIFLSIFTLGSLTFGGLDTNILFLLALAVIGLMITWVAGGPTKLEKMVKVLDSSEGLGMLILQIQNEEYANELLKLNPMSAELMKTV